jgi:RNA polymerase sigma-70 factor (ECF subfamily)
MNRWVALAPAYPPLAGDPLMAAPLLQRARAQLQQVAPSADEIREPADPGDLAVLNRYAAAFQNADMAALTELLRDDAVLEMPPLPAWFAGREHIALFLRAHLLRHPGGFAMVPTAANGQPALGAYRRGPHPRHPAPLTPVRHAPRSPRAKIFRAQMI